MSELSPTGKAVLKAYQLASIEDGLTAAAVIRVAVACTQQYQGKDCFSNNVFTCDADELLAIANELEAFSAIANQQPV